MKYFFQGTITVKIVTIRIFLCTYFSQDISMHHLRDQKYKSKNEIFKQYIEKQNSKGKKFGIQNSKKILDI